MRAFNKFQPSNSAQGTFWAQSNDFLINLCQQISQGIDAFYFEKVRTSI